MGSTYTVYINDTTKRSTHSSENSARHAAVTCMGNVFITRAMVVEDNTGEVCFQVKREVTYIRDR